MMSALIAGQTALTWVRAWSRVTPDLSRPAILIQSRPAPRIVPWRTNIGHCQRHDNVRFGHQAESFEPSRGNAHDSAGHALNLNNLPNRRQRSAEVALPKPMPKNRDWSAVERIQIDVVRQ